MDVRWFFSVQNGCMCKAVFQEKEKSQEKMQESGEFEMGGALGRANIITTQLFFFWGQQCIKLYNYSNTSFALLANYYKFDFDSTGFLRPSYV